jgi:hypothetical protein
VDGVAAATSEAMRAPTGAYEVVARYAGSKLYSASEARGVVVVTKIAKPRSSPI